MRSFIGRAGLLVSLLAGAVIGLPSLEIFMAVPDLDRGLLYIYGFNFGQAPEVLLNDSALEVLEASEDSITAALWDNIGSATYRLGVAREGYFNSSNKADWLDITIGAQGPAGPKGEKGDPGEPGARLGGGTALRRRVGGLPRVVAPRATSGALRWT